MKYTAIADELTFNVNGHQIAAKSWGDANGMPVLALHGWLDNAATFNRLAPRLTGLRLIALDLMGHGYSDHRPPSMPYYIWDNVVDVLGVADQLGLQRFSLLGHSMGASIATLVAGGFPERVDKVVLIEGIGPLVTPSEQSAEQLETAIKKRLRLQKREQKPYQQVDGAVRARMNGRWPVDHQAAKWLVERGLERREDGYYWRSDPNLILPSILRMSEAQVESFLMRMSAETLLILADSGIPQSERRIALLQHCQTQRLKGGHHLHLEEQAVAPVATLINEFYQA
ncbi:alpha/beta hydrolase [Amphritea sp. 1_MG-2023]|uniref:alpha/beta hydrolase n=1 Tax=Amphritea sp. 1_MG-2023 TaxID=3062670 RepID=UPI0026E344FC|nr:alpha/beta hydrolase [Amphritea sp. 1_MG-2023]MDO6563458.1 alpha/beta hydrolase [Amphritea sp. 1_MG-2023]